MIPRLLSQTWKSENLSGEAAQCRNNWVRHNPGLTCRLHDDRASRAVVKDVTPEFIDAYDALPFAVMRADIYRYAVIYRDGGIYADIDMDCLKPLPDELFTPSCLVAQEARLTHRRMTELDYPAPVQIANCIFGARPGYPLFLAAIRRAFALIGKAASISHADVEDLTGPKMFTRLFFEADWPGLSITPAVVLMAPLNYPNLWPINRSMYACHKTFGTWKDANGTKPLSRIWVERNRLVNPFPSRLLIDQQAYLNSLSSRGAA